MIPCTKLVVRVLLGAVFFCASCHVSALAETAGLPQTHGMAVYRIACGDELEIVVTGYPELSIRTVVLPDGTISFPFLGSVEAAGNDLMSLSESMQEELDRFIYDPQVTVIMRSLRGKHFSVLGEVKKAGLFVLDNQNMTVYEAIAQAEGFLPTAYQQQVSVMRFDSQGAQTSLCLDMSDTPAGKNDAFRVTIKPGDVIYVPSVSDKRQVCVIGKVAVPGRYSFSPGMTVVDILSVAGWITKEGVSNSIMLVRRDGGEKTFTRINAHQIITKADFHEDVLLQAGDIVYVPETFISKLSTFAGFFSSSIEPVASTYLRVYDATNPASYLVDR